MDTGSEIGLNRCFCNPLMACKPNKIAVLRHHKNFAETDDFALVGMEELLTQKCGEKLVGIQKPGGKCFWRDVVTRIDVRLSSKVAKSTEVVTRAFAENSEHRT